ncbi:hypothetical protein BSKO_00405 [Bryopsis sp. KO-2023]|nr:hypothetical protein BSKO_00405 [Bryopsis sp. KO-2023]
METKNVSVEEPPFHDSCSPTDVQLHAPVQVLRDPEDDPSLFMCDPELTSPDSVEGYVRDSLSHLEGRLEAVLDNISEELASEVSRERQHLMLMQEQVDKQAQCLQKEFGEIHKSLEQEKTQRTLVQQKNRDDNEHLGDSLRSISRELEELRSLVHKMKTPWMFRMLDNVCGVFKHCTIDGAKYSSLSST